MDDLLTPVSTTYRKTAKDDDIPFLSEVKQDKPEQKRETVTAISSLEDALEVLRNQPDYETLILALRFLTSYKSPDSASQPLAPSPKSAAVVHLLVTDIALNYWTLLLEGSEAGEVDSGKSSTSDAGLFVKCLRSVTGINAIVSQLKSLIQDSRSGAREVRRAGIALHLNLFTTLFAAVLGGGGSIREIWIASTLGPGGANLEKAQSQALVSLITNGRIPSLAAEALHLAETKGDSGDHLWIADGVAYSKWVARGITFWAKLDPSANETRFCSDLFARALSLGHHGRSGG